jgi:hypothetical protein
MHRPHIDDDAEVVGERHTHCETDPVSAPQMEDVLR